MKEIDNIRSNKGITLIALIITIIVLLILAGVSITSVMGENGIIGKSQSATTATLHSEIYEKLALEADNYWALKSSDNYTGDLLSYFEENGYIEVPKREVEDAEGMVGTNNISGISQINELLQSGLKQSTLEQTGSEKIGYDINIEKLLGRKTSLGIGSNFKNVYRLEESIASAESNIRDTDTETETETEMTEYPEDIEGTNKNEITYEVCYYDSNGNRTVLGELIDECQGVISVLG